MINNGVIQLSDDMLLNFTQIDLDTLKEWAEPKAAQWNGKYPGQEEDMAHVMTEIINTATQLQGLLEQAKEYENVWY